MTCNVTHAPGQSYVCWTHRKFLPWSTEGSDVSAWDSLEGALADADSNNWRIESGHHVCADCADEQEDR